ncbi:MAG: YfiR family protein [Gammaproteobacteria bacterium]
MNRTLHRLLLATVVALVSHLPAVASADAVSEYSIKAAFIYNFARFTRWADESDTLKICIYGKDPFGDNIDKLDGKKINGRTVRVTRTQLIDDVRSCHIAFLNIIPPERHLFKQALNKIQGANVLTVADAANVVDFGVMIGMRIDGNKVGFEVNHTAAKASDLEISAKLLVLAKEVI